MDATNIATLAAANKTAFPDRAAVRTRLVEIDDAIAAIRAQIAAADLERQATRRKIDPQWFHRARTALRHLRRERTELLATMPAAATRKDSLKDSIIAVLRERHDQETWSRIMDEAHGRLSGEVR